jgi:hypothetical protein
MAAQKKKHDENQLRALYEYRSLKECPNCGELTSKVKESRKVFDGTRRRYSCLTCDHKYTTFEVSSDLYDELRSLRNKISKLQQIFSDVAPPVSQPPERVVLDTEVDEIPCCDCVHLTPYGCSFDIPEAQTEAARGCNLFKTIISDNMLL